MKGVAQLRIVAFDAGDGEDVLFVDQVVGVALVVDGEVAASQLVVVENIVTTDIKAMENGAEEARKPSDMIFFWVEASGSTNGVVGRKLDVRWVSVPFILVGRPPPYRVFRPFFS